MEDQKIEWVTINAIAGSIIITPKEDAALKKRGIDLLTALKEIQKGIIFEDCLREEFLINTQNYPKEYHKLFAEKFARAEKRYAMQTETYKSRCCGRCDGVNDICVTDMICEDHKVEGCEICYGPRGQK